MVGISHNGRVIVSGSSVRNTQGFISIFRINPIDGSFTEDGNITTPVSTNTYEHKVCISGDGNVIAYTEHASSLQNRIQILRYNGQAWVDDSNKILSNSIEDLKLSYDGSILCVCTEENIYVFRYLQNAWNTTINTTNTITNNDNLIYLFKQISLSSDGNTISIGTQTNVQDTQYTLVYRFNGSNWIGNNNNPIQTNKQTGSNEYDYTTTSISKDGNSLAIGIRYANTVIVYNYVNQTWTETTNLDVSIPSGQTLVYYGCSLDFSPDGKKLVVGAYTYDFGTTFLWEKNVDNTWKTTPTKKKTILPDTTSTHEGYSVAMSNNRIVSGAPQSNRDIGRILTYCV